MPNKRALFYIDGFNLYYSALKPNPGHRWLNLKSLADSIVPNNTTVSCIKYFSAPVSGNVDPEGQKKQVIYFRALKTIDTLETILGAFTTQKEFMRPVSTLKTQPDNYQWNLPAPEKVKVKFTTEKRTDVNLASHLIYDACTNKFDIAYVITNDTDFIDAIKMVIEKIQKQVVIAIVKRPLEKEKPNNHPNNDTLIKSASGVYFITEALIKRSQFPDEIQNKRGQIIRKPAAWK